MGASRNCQTLLESSHEQVSLAQPPMFQEDTKAERAASSLGRLYRSRIERATALDLLRRRLKRAESRDVDRH